MDITISLRCRDFTQSFLFTFMDHDGSISHAAAIKPWNVCNTNNNINGCPVILSLSGSNNNNNNIKRTISLNWIVILFYYLLGVGVKPQNQADSHKYMNPKKKTKGSDCYLKFNVTDSFKLEDDWLFGMKDSWIICPERDGAHNWEGTGYFTACK